MMNVSLCIFFQYIPRAQVLHLQSGSKNFIYEIRRLTILFVLLDGDSLTPKSQDNGDGVDAPSLERMQTIFSVLQTCLYESEGSVRQFIQDDKVSHNTFYFLSLHFVFGIGHTENSNSLSRERCLLDCSVYLL